MKLKSASVQCGEIAITLFEALVVVIVVFILIIMIIPITTGPGRPAKVARARLEISDITTAIQAYRKIYGRYPAPTNVEAAALAAKEDFTYGGAALNSILGPGNSTPVNADVMAILMDLTNYSHGGLTVNSNHNLNSQETVFLNAKFTRNTNDPGVGTDLVYRDPWGHPFIISMDLNGDDRCTDAFYKNHLVSQKNGVMGFDGLTNAFDSSGTNDFFEYEGGVMVWSLGPDGKADVSKPSTSAPNKDNVVSWR